MSERSNVSIAEILGDNYYIDKLTSSDYSPAVGDTVTITLLVKDVFGDPVTGQTRTVTCTEGSFVSMNGTSITASSSVEVTTGSGGTVTLGLSVSVADNIIVSDGRAECVVSSLSTSITNITTWESINLLNGLTLVYNPALRLAKLTVNRSTTGTLNNTTFTNISGFNPIPADYRPHINLIFATSYPTLILRVDTSGYLQWRVTSGSVASPTLWCESPFWHY